MIAHRLTKSFRFLLLTLVLTPLYIPQHTRVRLLANAEIISENLILQLKLVPGYKRPDATEDQYHTKAILCKLRRVVSPEHAQFHGLSSIQIQSLRHLQVEICNQVIGKSKNEAIDTSNYQTTTMKVAKARRFLLRFLESSGGNMVRPIFDPST